METANFARRLRNSKILRYNPSGVPVTVTSSKSRSQPDEYGLKSRLPSSRRSSPYIQVTEFDSEYARPKWRAATQDALFSERWEESGLGATAEGGTKAGFVASSSFDPTSQPDAEGLKQLAASQSRRRRATPDFAWLTDRDFDRYLDQLRTLRPAFQSFCDKEARRERERAETLSSSPTPSTSTSTSVDLFTSARTDAKRGELIIKFLSQQSDELNAAMSIRGPYIKRGHHLQPYPHPLFGLQYAPSSTFHNARFSEPLPGRLLSKTSAEPPRSGYHQDMTRDLSSWAKHQREWAASTMGIVGVVDERKLSNDAVPTQWLPNEQTGYRDAEAGKGFYRIEEAEVEMGLKPRAEHRRSAAEEPWLYEKTLDGYGGHRAVRRDGGTREWRDHPGVPERPVKLALRQVDEEIEAATPLPGSPRWIAGHAGVRSAIRKPQPVRCARPLLRCALGGDSAHRKLASIPRLTYRHRRSI